MKNDSVTPYVSFHEKNDIVTPLILFDDDWWKTTVLPLMFYFMKKRHCYPFGFIWWQRIKNNSVTPYVLFHEKNKCSIRWQPIKNRQCYPLFYLMTTDKKRQRYPIRYSRWRPMRNRQCYPLCFNWWGLINNHSGTTYVLFDDDWWNTTVLPLMFFSLKKRHCCSFDFIWWRLMKNDTVTPYVLFHEKNNIATPSILFDDNG
jgi:hypothetical protein